MFNNLSRVHDKTNIMTFRPSEDSDQPGHPPSLIRVFAVPIKKSWVLSYPLSAQRRLIRLCGCAGRAGHFDGFVVLRLIYYTLDFLTCVNNIDFYYFEAFYFMKHPEKAMVFMCQCTNMLVSAYYVILQTSSSTHLYLSWRSTRDELTPQCSSSLLGARYKKKLLFLFCVDWHESYT